MMIAPGAIAVSNILARGGGSPAVTFPAEDSASLQFAQANETGLSGNFSYVTASNITETLFGSAGAMVVQVEVPWDRYGQGQIERHFILGNDWVDLPRPNHINLSVVGPVEKASAKQVVFGVSNSTQSRQGVLDLSGKPRRLTICISTDGSDLNMRVYSDGVDVAGGAIVWDGGATDFTGLALQASGFLVGCAGSSFSNALNPFASGQTRGFDGSIKFLGYHNGAVSNADLIALSNGQAPNDVLSAANWIIGREPTDYTASSFDAATWATADTRGAWASSGTHLPGGDIVPARDGSGNTFALDPIVDGQVWGMAPNGTSVSVPLSGTSSGLTGGVEARIRYINGTVLQDWTAVTGASLNGGGAWSGTITWPQSVDGWCYVEVRDAATQALMQRSRAHCGIGWVIGMVGQSNIEFPVKATAGAFAPTNPGNISLCFRFRTQSTVSGNAPGSGSLVVDRVTTLSPRTNGVSAMADELKARYGNIPVMIFDMTQEGSGVADLQNDAQTNRLWSDSPGSQIAVVGNRVSSSCIEWGASITEFRIDEDHDALIKGDDSGGLVTWTISNNNYLWGADFFHGSSMGVALMQGPGLGQILTTLDYDVAWFAFPDEPEFQYTLLQKAYADENPGVVIGTSMNGVELDGGHAVEALAKDRASRALLIAGMAACGVEPIVEPLPVDLTINSAVDEATVFIDLPNDGDLQTEWSANGETVPAGQNPVQGIEIFDVSESPSPRLPSRSGFTTAIGDTGTGAAPNRRGTITITKDSGSWERGSLVSIIPGFGMSYRNDYFDLDLWKGWPRESSSAMGGLGLLVPQGRATFAMPVDPVADLGANAWFDVSADLTCYQERTGAAATTPAGDGDPVGTVVVSGASGGYFTAPSDAARPIRRRFVIPMRDVLADNNVRFHYMRVGEETWYLDFDGIDDQLVYDGGGLVPNQVDYAIGCAVATNDLTTGRHVMSEVDNGLTPDGFVLFQNVNNGLGGFGGTWRAWIDQSLSDPHTMSIIDGVREFSPMLILNSAAGREFITRRTSTTWSNPTPASSFTTIGTFRIGAVDWYSNFQGRLFGLFVSGDAFTTTQKRQANVWLGQMLGQNNPYW